MPGLKLIVMKVRKGAERGHKGVRSHGITLHHVQIPLVIFSSQHQQQSPSCRCYFSWCAMTARHRDLSSALCSRIRSTQRRKSGCHFPFELFETLWSKAQITHGTWGLTETTRDSSSSAHGKIHFLLIRVRPRFSSYDFLAGGKMQILHTQM